MSRDHDEQSMTDLLRELAQHLSPPPVARIEVGQAVLDAFKAAARCKSARPEDVWRPVGWTPPPPIGALFGTPVVLREDLEPGAWQAIDFDGEILKRGTL